MADNVIPFPRQSAETVTAPDIRTSDIPPRLADTGDGHIREFSPVVHDKPPTERKLSFGRSITVEPMSVSRDNARLLLATVYGYDTADSMIVRAEYSGEVVNGQEFTTVDSQYKIRGKWNVTSDKSRPGEGIFVIFANILRQHTRKSR